MSHVNAVSSVSRYHLVYDEMDSWPFLPGCYARVRIRIWMQMEKPSIALVQFSEQDHANKLAVKVGERVFKHYLKYSDRGFELFEAVGNRVNEVALTYALEASRFRFVRVGNRKAVSFALIALKVGDPFEPHDKHWSEP